MLQQIVSDPWFQLANFTLAIAGILLAVYYYFKQRNKKALRYALKDTELIAPPRVCGEHIQITYARTRVARVRRVSLLLWNAGDVTINFQEDMRRVTLAIPGRSLLGVYVALADDAGANFRFEPDGDTANITFSELRSGEGCLFYFDYEGKRSSARLLTDEKHKGISRRFEPGSLLGLERYALVLLWYGLAVMTARDLGGWTTALPVLALFPLLLVALIAFSRRRLRLNSLSAFRRGFRRGRLRELID